MQQVEIGGARMNFVDQGQGLPVLFVHGFPLDHQMWKGQIEYFSKSNRVIAPDLIGFGQSECRDGDMTIAGMADDLAALIDHLEIPKLVFCGLSMGGYIGWQFWERHARRVAGLVACDTRVVADTEDVARGRRILAASLLADDVSKAELKRRVELFAETLMVKLFGEETRLSQTGLVDQTKLTICNAPPQSIAKAQLAMAARKDFSLGLPTIDVPTLVVVGRQDAISSPREMEGFAKSIPDAEFFEMAGGHMAPLEHPDEFNQKLQEFLRDLAAKKDVNETGLD